MSASRHPVVPIQPSSGYRMDIDQVRHIMPQLIDALSDAVVVVDREHRVVAANRRYVEAFGTQRIAVAGSHCTDALHCPEATGGGGQCSACEAFEHGRPLLRVRNITDPSGVQRRWEGTFNPLVSTEGDVTHMVEVWRDITERTQLEAQLAHSERLASLGTLAAGVAHELNNPMASILAGVERLQRWLSREHGIEQERKETAGEVLQGLERETQRCTETTGKLLLLAQPYRAGAAWVDMNRAMRDTVSLLNYQMSRQNVSVVQDLDPTLPAVWGREAGLRGVCMNLCMNAVQAMKDGGTLTVRTGHLDPWVTLVIQDTGHGIQLQDLERIWDPFFTTKPIGQGTGLGLSITRQVVYRHGGLIRVESRPGAGARFTVELPINGPGGRDE